MTREELIIENEALHGLLAAACETLLRVTEWDYVGFPEDARHVAGEAYDTLAQIKEGYVA